MAKWKLETGEIIESNGNFYVDVDNQQMHKLMYHLEKKLYKPLAYAPNQTVGKESDFTILLDDGKTIKATLMKEPKDLGEYWQQNKVEGFELFGHLDSFYYLSNVNYPTIPPYIPKSWSLERQIDTLNKLIEIYK